RQGDAGAGVNITKSMNFARLNHILIPTTKEGRDRFRRSLLGRLVAPLGFFYSALSDEGRVIAVAALGIGAFGLDTAQTAVYLLSSALAGLIVASLLATRFHRLGGVRVEVDAPRRVTLGDSITFSVVLHNDGPGARDRHAVRVHGPFLPWDGTWTGSPGRTDTNTNTITKTLAAGQRARVELTARFSQRGEHHLDPFSVTALVPLGLAQGRPVSSAGVKFLVVPRIARVVRLCTPPGSRYQP